VAHVFTEEQLLETTTAIFQATGAPAEEAAAVAGHLVTASVMGYDTHGVIRIPQYVGDVKRGAIVPGAPVRVERETETTAVVDGGWNFGQVAGLRAMEIAMAKAKSGGIAMVVTHRSNHAGRLGAYTQQAAEAGFLALAFCNSPPQGHFVLPWGGTQARLATNPISFAIPSSGGFPVLADFATAETTEGALRLYRNLNKPLPAGWILDAKGQPSTSADDFYGPPKGSILPFGGARGYRGFALSLLVEIMSGLLGGSPTVKDQAGNGLAFIAIDPTAFLPPEQFGALMQELREYVKSSPPAPGSSEVLLPGEPEAKRVEERRESGIPLDDNTWEQIRQAAASVGIVM
jgi:uncharacterized oxidoreductase